MEEIKQKIEEGVELLPVEKAVSEREAERRAGHFLRLMAQITDTIDSLGDEKIRASSLQTAIYPKLMAQDGSKQVTEKKANVEGHADYIEARENLEAVENKLNYLKTYFKIFEHAHVFYRQLAKGEFNG